MHQIVSALAVDFGSATTVPLPAPCMNGTTGANATRAAVGATVQLAAAGANISIVIALADSLLRGEEHTSGSLQ